MKQIQINNNLALSNSLPIVLIAGPCQIESEDHALTIAGKISDIAKKLGIGYVYKSSFDKANRTSINSKRGIGIKGACKIFDVNKKHIACPIITDIHHPDQAQVISQYVDIIQIPALLCRQTDLIVAAANSGRIVNIKKGQFLAPADISNAID